MNVLAILLDGHNWGHSLPPLPIGIAAYLAPMTTLACAWIVARNRRHVGYALLLASSIAAALIFPLSIIVVNVYYDSYRPEDIALLFFEVGFPFLATALFYFWPTTKSVEASEPSQPRSEDSAATYPGM